MTVLAEARAVSVVYGHGPSAVHALRDADFAIQGGDSVSLWGRSGSGKTTLLHVLGGLVEPTAGAARWHGEPLASLDAAARDQFRRSGIAYVFQGSNLLPHFSAYENVAFALQEGEASHAPEDLLQMVGLASKLDAMPSELSGGEAQRVAMARALGQH